MFALALAFCARAAAQNAGVPIGDVVAADAAVRGSVVLTGAGARVLSGSTVSAGSGVATLRLARGGQVRICPRTNLTLSASASGRELMLGISDGSLELNYGLSASADALQTPDLRFMLAGPGTFHLALGADARGNTCVRPLPGNSAAVIVSELMSDATYQVKADEPLMFLGGKLSQVSHDLPPDCGCPAAAPLQRAAEQPMAPAASTVMESVKPESAQPVNVAQPTPASSDVPGETGHALSPPSGATTQSATALGAVPETHFGPTHVEVEAPFVFRGDAVAPPPEITATVRWSDRAPLLQLLEPVVSPAAQLATSTSAQPAQKKGVLLKIRAFFAAMFR